MFQYIQYHSCKDTLFVEEDALHGQERQDVVACGQAGKRQRGEKEKRYRDRHERVSEHTNAYAQSIKHPLCSTCSMPRWP